MKQKIVCIDYDGTYTEFPELLDLIIFYCKSHHVKVILCTMRHKHEIDSHLESVIEKVDETYFTDRNAKIPYLNNLGIFPDIFIDDNPKWLISNAC